MLTAEYTRARSRSRSIMLRIEFDANFNDQSEQPQPEALHLGPKVTKVVPGFPMFIADKSSKSAQLVPLFNPA